MAQILYSKNAKVYIAARSEERATKAIADIQRKWPQSMGKLVFMPLDLADLSKIRPAVDRFTSQESKLHVLFNNAGVQALNNDGSVKTAQGHELHLGVNVLGVFLLTKLLTPILAATAKTEPANSVRVVWVSSMGTEVIGEKSRGVSLDYLEYWPKISALERYGYSKAGNWLHGVEYARRYKAEGIVCMPCNPGHLRSELYREGGWLFKTIINATVLQPPVMGAYTELFCGISNTLTINHSGRWGESFQYCHTLLASSISY